MTKGIIKLQSTRWVKDPPWSPLARLRMQRAVEMPGLGWPVFMHRVELRSCDAADVSSWPGWRPTCSKRSESRLPGLCLWGHGWPRYPYVSMVYHLPGHSWVKLALDCCFCLTFRQPWGYHLYIRICICIWICICICICMCICIYHTILYYVMLCYILFYYIILYYIILYHIISYYIILYYLYIILYYIILQYMRWHHIIYEDTRSYEIILYFIAWDDMILFDILYVALYYSIVYDVIWYDIIWADMILYYYTKQDDMILSKLYCLYDMIWYDMIWYFVVWDDIILHCTI